VVALLEMIEEATVVVTSGRHPPHVGAPLQKYNICPVVPGGTATHELPFQ
jgi:hypothetical protein